MNFLSLFVKALFVGLIVWASVAIFRIDPLVFLLTAPFLGFTIVWLILRGPRRKKPEVPTNTVR